LEKEKKTGNKGIAKALSKKETDLEKDSSPSKKGSKKGKKELEEESKSPMKKPFLPPIENQEKKYGIETDEDLKDIKFLLSTPVALTYNTNVMRIALNMQEEKIASLLIAYYTVKIDEDMMLRAVKTNQIDFLYCVFAFNKNFCEVASKTLNSDKMSDIDSDGHRYKTFTLDFVFKKLIDYSED